jgi:serine/threonine protein kinase
MGAVKKWIILAVLAFVCAATVPLLEIQGTTQRQVIYIKGGEPVLVDSVTQTDQFVLYTTNGKSGMFMADDVTSVGSVKVGKKRPLLFVIDREKTRFLTSMGLEQQTARSVDSRLIIFFGTLALGGLFLALFRLIAALARRSVATLKKEEITPAPGDAVGPLDQGDPIPSDLRDIAVFFLELYRLQKGADPEARARFSMTADSAASKMKRFELGIQGGNDWLVRRMSIGPLGEETGSKSKCFYVIYDTHMVIKIPPSPITDMEKYVHAIKREVRIADQLAPITCIIPMVSVALNKIKTLAHEPDGSREQLEEQYIRLVEEKPEYENFLKIGDRFAFFMELTNNFFLGRVIGELHEAKNKIGDEFREAPDVPWDQDAFTARYGLDALPVFEGLQALYQSCEKEAKRIVREAGRRDQLHTFQIKNWFLACIAAEKCSQVDKTADPELLAKIEAGFAEIFKTNQEKIDTLTRMLTTQVNQKAFIQSRQRIENIASNLLRLLARLKKKSIALRDLKPDNLFLDASPNEYPVFLNNPASFAIGVIDVETAISLIPDRDGKVSQPLLGGTPLYATPAHVLRNETIAANFGDVARVLHLQDWFATIAIVFKAITGNNLFRRAARSFPAVLKILKSGRSKADPDEETVKAMSRKFWAAAAADIRTSLTAFADALNELTLTVPDSMAAIIEKELEREIACLDAAIDKHISHSPLFKTEKNKKFLLEAPGDVIAKQIAKWENISNLPEKHRKMAPQMTAFLKNLKRLKWGVTEKRIATTAIAGASHQISAYCLLEAMFQIVFRSMYKARWKALPAPDKISDQQMAVENDRSMVTKILNKN